MENPELSVNESERSASISIDAAPRLNIAFHQNQVPAIGGIELRNDTDQDLADVTVKINSTPVFLESKKFTFDHVKAGAVQRLSPVPLKLDPQILLGLSERLRGEIRVSAQSRGIEIAACLHECELLSPHEWTGLSSAPELIAAFVRPNDPAIDLILRRAAVKLERAGRSNALDGYRGGGKSRAWELAEAIWAALCDEAIVYALPPASFETDGQKVRSPSAILERKVGTCLDLTLLLAAAFEQAGLNPIIVMSKGHALVGLWLVNQEFSHVAIDEPQVLRKRRDLDDLILIETTLLTSRQRFQAAVDQGRTQIDEGAERPFEMAIDVKRARLRRIKPLSLGNETVPAGATAEARPASEMDLSAPPAFVDEVKIAEIEQAQLGRLDNWKRKLLDLSLRNRLLNFKTGKGTVSFVCPEPAALEDKLASGEEIRLLPKAAVMEGGDPRNAELQRRTQGEDAARAYARDALLRNDVHTDLTADDLDDRLTELYRAARNAMEESGANSLHLALGFVRWSPADKKGADYRAPLILLPVSLQRRSMRSGYKLVRHDDDARINPTLLQMLRQDFDLTIPEFEGPELPMDNSGLDIAQIWRIARKHLVDAKGFEVTEDVVLSTFSFAKYLMWKDLVERTGLLKRNPVVAHLIDTPTAAYGDGSSLPEERNLDHEAPSKELFIPLPADSSQVAAVVAASRSKDFVLFGPPGTGKSQTIANMITQLLGEGKTVLFVSQKTTALEVVRKRLDRLGLGQFCLEVHSAKAQKSAVLGQLLQAWENRSAETARAWSEKAEELDRLRSLLNGVVAALHQYRRNGLTAYQAMGKVVAHRSAYAGLRLDFASFDQHDEMDMRRLRDICRDVRLSLANVGNPATHPLRLLNQTDWSPQWRDNIVAASSRFIATAGAFEKAYAPIVTLLGAPPLAEPSDVLNILNFGILAFRAEAVDAANFLQSDISDLRRRFEAWSKDRDTIVKRTGDLQRQYRDGVFALDLAALLAEWRAAEAANFLVRGGRKKKVTQVLAAFAESGETDDVATEIVKLIDVAAARQTLAGHTESMAAFGPLWRGGETGIELLQSALAWVEAVRSAAAACATSSRPSSAWLAALKSLVESFRIEPDKIDMARNAMAVLLESYKSFDAARNDLARLAMTDVNFGIAPGAGWLAQVVVELSGWPSAMQRSQSWCAWRRAAGEAEQQGLAPLIHAVQEGRLSADHLSESFEIAYARWWIDRVIDAEKPLREFIANSHEDAIARFAKLDVELADLARKVVAASLSKDVPARTAFGKDPEWGILSRELTKRARHIPLRQLFGQMPKALTTLAPCLMMSPLSIAQFLPADAKPFDVIIFDEASQMPVWDAVGAIARGKQVIVVGDPKQLPPTTFFDRAAGETTDFSEIEDLESILDECLAANIPHKRLTWHYRSRHESLIAFSNNRYYEGRLVTFPSPATEDRAVRYMHVPDGAYERGGARVNKGEARAIVTDIVRRLREPRFMVEKSSLGVVTFNSEQQRLIENLLDHERRAHPEIETFFSRDWHEPVFVKNLESVQGDERDIILFSVAYGPDAAGHITQNFGPLNLDGGARRLNVAITRAREELAVFATLRPEQIDLSRAKGEGVRDFKHFLEFAQRGPRALAEASAPTGREEDSDFERAVRQALEARGWIVHPQVGVSGFRIDLGVVHPDAPGRYLAAVECDGATYHRSATARDRDRLREGVLRNLGWRVRRVWSTDWWMDAERAIARLQAQLESDLAAQRTLDADAAAAADNQSEPQKSEIAQQPEPALEQDAKGDSEESPMEVAPPESEPARQKYADNAADRHKKPIDSTTAIYQVADLAKAGFKPEPSRFYETSYRPILRRMAAHIITAEGPVFDDVVIRRIARFHGFQRAGTQIRETVNDVIERRFPKSREGERAIYWPEGSARTIEMCRLSGSEIRDHSDIPDVELKALAKKYWTPDVTAEEVAARMAADLHIERLRQTTREKLESIARSAKNKLGDA